MKKLLALAVVVLTMAAGAHGSVVTLYNTGNNTPSGTHCDACLPVPLASPVGTGMAVGTADGLITSTILFVLVFEEALPGQSQVTLLSGAAAPDLPTVLAGPWEVFAASLTGGNYAPDPGHSYQVFLVPPSGASQTAVPEPPSAVAVVLLAVMLASLSVRRER